MSDANSSSNEQLPEFTYEQIVEGKRPPVLSGPYIPAYLAKAEIKRLEDCIRGLSDHAMKSAHEIGIMLQALKTIAANDRMTAPHPIGPAMGAGISQGLEWNAKIAKQALSAVEAAPRGEEAT